MTATAGHLPNWWFKYQTTSPTGQVPPSPKQLFVGKEIRGFELRQINYLRCELKQGYWAGRGRDDTRVPPSESHESRRVLRMSVGRWILFPTRCMTGGDCGL
jgi:hypothetical protein